MTDEEKAIIILQELGKFVEVDAAEERWYLYGIQNGLNQIEIQETDKEKSLSEQQLNKAEQTWR